MPSRARRLASSLAAADGVGAMDNKATLFGGRSGGAPRSRAHAPRRQAHGSCHRHLSLLETIRTSWARCRISSLVRGACRSACHSQWGSPCVARQVVRHGQLEPFDRRRTLDPIPEVGTGRRPQRAGDARRDRAASGTRRRGAPDRPAPRLALLADRRDRCRGRSASPPPDRRTCCASIAVDRPNPTDAFAACRRPPDLIQYFRSHASSASAKHGLCTLWAYRLRKGHRHPDGRTTVPLLPAQLA